MVTKQSTYQPFTTESVVTYLKAQKYIPQDHAVDCEEIGDGNLNYVFRVVVKGTGRSLIVKQALPYAKVVGESWPLTLDRARIEAESLKRAAKYLPEHVPKVYGMDNSVAATIMEDLSAYVVLRKGLIKGIKYPNLAAHIGKYIAYTLFHNSDFGLEPSEKKLIASQFVNPELCKITENLVFTAPFFDHETNNFPKALQPDVTALWNDKELKLEIAKLKQIYLTKSEALIHGDLHTGSMFVTKNSTKVIDPEFGFFGPIGFDIGAFFANVILNYHSQDARIDELYLRKNYQEYLIQVIIETWGVFENEFTNLCREKGKGAYLNVPGFLDFVLERILQDAVGFAGIKIIRRTIGLAQVEDINGIEDRKQKLDVQRNALQTGKQLILHRKKVEIIHDLLRFVKEAGEYVEN